MAAIMDLSFPRQLLRVSLTIVCTRLDHVLESLKMASSVNKRATELLGFSHFDTDKVFDWSRVSDNIPTRDVHGSWMKFEMRSTNNNSEEHQSIS